MTACKAANTTNHHPGPRDPNMGFSSVRPPAASSHLNKLFAAGISEGWLVGFGSSTRTDPSIGVLPVVS